MILIPPDPSRPIVTTKGIMTQPLQAFINMIPKLAVIVGSGSPEGTIIAEVGQEYMDRNGIAGAIKYIKRDSDFLGDRSKGWVLV